MHIVVVEGMHPYLFTKKNKEVTMAYRRSFKKRGRGRTKKKRFYTIQRGGVRF